MSHDVNSHLRKEALVGGLSNAFFNGLIAWLLMKNGPDLAWTGQHSFVIDVIATAFLLPLIVALIVIPLQRSKLRKGKLAAVSLPEGSALGTFAARFPSSTWKSALLFGLLGTLTFAPLALFGFYLAGVTTLSPEFYAPFKGAWAGVMAAVLVVPMVLVALRPASADAEPS